VPEEVDARLTEIDAEMTPLVNRPVTYDSVEQTRAGVFVSLMHDGRLRIDRGYGSDIAARDAQDLMAWPFFSLAKSKRVRPIDFQMGEVSILVEATAEHPRAADRHGERSWHAARLGRGRSLEY
jgi:plasmid replication initiation protein